MGVDVRWTRWARAWVAVRPERERGTARSRTIGGQNGKLEEQPPPARGARSLAGCGAGKSAVEADVLWRSADRRICWQDGRGGLGGGGDVEVD